MSQRGSPAHGLWIGAAAGGFHGVDIREYLTWRTLPRPPRPLVLDEPRNCHCDPSHRNPRVEGRDVLLAKGFAVRGAVWSAPVTGVRSSTSCSRFLPGRRAYPKRRLCDRCEAGVRSDCVGRAAVTLRALYFLASKFRKARLHTSTVRRRLWNKELARTAQRSARRYVGDPPAFRPVLSLILADRALGGTDRADDKQRSRFDRKRRQPMR